MNDGVVAAAGEGATQGASTGESQGATQGATQGAVQGAVTQAPGGAGAAAVQGAAQPAAAWYGALDQETVGWLQTKAWFGADPAKADISKSFPEMVKSVRGLEKLVGDPSSRLNVPKTPDDVEGWNNVWTKLGRPADWKGYEYKAPEGGDQEFADNYSQMAHKHGLTTRQMQGLAEDWSQFGMAKQAAMKEAAETQFITNSQNELNALRKSWGNDADMKLAAAQRAGVAFGIKPEMMDKLERAIGTTDFLTVMANIGGAISEDTGIGQGGTTINTPITPEAASAKLKQLQSDKEWIAKYQKGDKDAVAEFRRLTEAKAAGMAA